MMAVLVSLPMLLLPGPFRLRKSDRIERRAMRSAIALNFLGGKLSTAESAPAG
jgi:hypothetical protein